MREASQREPARGIHSGAQCLAHCENYFSINGRAIAIIISTMQNWACCATLIFCLYVTVKSEYLANKEPL